MIHSNAKLEDRELPSGKVLVCSERFLLEQAVEMQTKKSNSIPKELFASKKDEREAKKMIREANRKFKNETLWHGIV